MASRDLVREVAPEFTTTADGIVDAMLERAARRLDSTEWADLYTDGCVYLAAHLLTLRARASAGSLGAGPVVAQGTGDLSVAYGAVVGVIGDDAKYATTPYGIEYLNLRRLIATPGFCA